MAKSVRECEVTRWNDSGSETCQDFVAVEEPLQVVVDGRPLAVLMRTPDHDEVLVMGFLLTEGIISTADQVRRIDLEAKDNHALVFLIDDHECDWERLTRHLFSASSCGLCGKATVDAILQNHPPIDHHLEIKREVILQAPAKMRKAQENFQSTGGIHASGIFSQGGDLLVLHEDVGRHNALDKVIGEGLMKDLNFSQCFLLVSGRISFELMQKAVAARIPLVAGISAPSSLAVEFAKDSGQTLIGFLRPPSMNLYAGKL
ncbi:MAG: formate dehydrogenase accessory sulfurtransferase FdhD [Akkermansiaceae bacterium]|jgi:FdhD protein